MLPVPVEDHHHHHGRFDFHSHFPLIPLNPPLLPIHIPLGHLHIPLTPLNPVLGDGSDNSLLGTDARDLILGGRGDDIINGGLGDDVEAGGRGNDTFVFGHDFGKDVILDFSRGHDLIDLTHTIVQFQDLTISEHHGNTLVESTEGTIVLPHVHGLDASDFLFAVKV